MEFAQHGSIHLVRAFTTPAKVANMGSHGTTSPLVQSQGHTSSNYSIHSQLSNRSSDTTQGTTQSTLFTAPPLPSHASSIIGVGSSATSSSHDVTASANIMNSVADASSSLFQICVALRQRLAGVRGLDEALLEEEEDADEDTDPVTLLWRTFRRGYPLILLYNALRPSHPLVLPDTIKEEKRGKAATLKFLQACMADLKFPQEELFIVSDLFGDDTTGFVKVARVVNRVLDVLVSRGLAEDIRPTASDFEQAAKGMKRTQRQHIISELVTTERTYVQHLELLQAFKHLVEEKGVIPGDAIHDIFLNLNALLDFQRRFLIRVEQTNAQPEDEQNWGRLFLLYCEAFKVYEPYIANQRKCEKIVVAEFPKLKEAGGSLEMRQMVESPTSLYGFLMKPFQRLSKYPLFLEDLYKKGDLDEYRKQDLLHGKEAATSVLARTNMAVDREEKAKAVEELKTRVEQWKGHDVDQFGELLLYGIFTVLKSENMASGKDGERQYHVYLFETILLCCKSIDLSKPKNRLATRNLADSHGKPKLQLKGRIFMQNVTDLVSLAKPGSYTCQIFWKGDPSIENFIIRFTTEDALRKWAQQIEQQRRKYRDRVTRVRISDGARAPGTSATEFMYMQQHQTGLENPYRDETEDDDDEDSSGIGGSSSGQWSHVGYPGQSDFSQSRNGSATSLRSRSTTGESSFQPPSIASSARAPPTRFPTGSFQHQQALSLRTRDLQQQAVTQSPSERGMDSYFSPTETPVSTRTSTSSGMYPFPRQMSTSSNEYYQDGQGSTRFTAPAIARPQQHPGGVSNGYAPPGRGPRPSYTGTAALHSSQQLPTTSRNRSASSPDIHNGQRARLAGPQPPVPNVPASFQHSSQAINRSMNNSPALSINATGRDSPVAHRERQYSRTDYSPIDHGSSGLARQDGQFQTSRTTTPVPVGGFPRGGYPSPPASHQNQTGTPIEESTPAMPSQLKVKVICPSVSQTLTLVVPITISCQSLKDRIDAKLQRSTTLTLSDRGPREGQVKLKYLDEDDYVSIQSDEDVQDAFESWKEQVAGDPTGGAMVEIELYCQR